MNYSISRNWIGKINHNHLILMPGRIILMNQMMVTKPNLIFLIPAPMNLTLQKVALLETESRFYSDSKNI
jgi:hypothetical protein